MQNQTFKISLERAIKSKLALSAIGAVLTLLDVTLHKFQIHNVYTYTATAEQSCGHAISATLAGEMMQKV